MNKGNSLGELSLFLGVFLLSRFKVGELKVFLLSRFKIGELKVAKNTLTSYIQHGIFIMEVGMFNFKQVESGKKNWTLLIGVLEDLNNRVSDELLIELEREYLEGEEG